MKKESTIQIRDKRQGEWLWVYNALIADPHISPLEKMVYCAIASFGGYQEIRPSIEQIAKRGNLGERTVQRSIKVLEKTGYLMITKSTGRGNANVYDLLAAPKGCQKCTLLLQSDKSERVPENAENSPERVTVQTPHKGIKNIDIKRSNKEQGASASQDVGSESNPQREKDIAEVIDAFAKNVNPACKMMFGHKPQRAAAGRLIDLYTTRQILNVITQVIPVSNRKAYMPTITTPIQLEQKWAQLAAAWQKERSKATSKGKAIIE